jgi:hypothetical protein
MDICWKTLLRLRRRVVRLLASPRGIDDLERTVEKQMQALLLRDGLPGIANPERLAVAVGFKIRGSRPMKAASGLEAVLALQGKLDPPDLRGQREALT